MSTKSAAEKLLIKANTTVWSSSRSKLALVEPLPDGVRVVSRLERATTGLVFAEDADALRRVLESHRDELAHPDILWIAYPKGNRADINRDSVWPILGEFGMRPIGQVSLDDVWSALRFRPMRQDEPAFTGGR